MIKDVKIHEYEVVITEHVKFRTTVRSVTPLTVRGAYRKARAEQTRLRKLGWSGGRVADTEYEVGPRPGSAVKFKEGTVVHGQR